MGSYSFSISNMKLIFSRQPAFRFSSILYALLSRISASLSSLIYASRASTFKLLRVRWKTALCRNVRYLP